MKFILFILLSASAFADANHWNNIVNITFSGGPANTFGRPTPTVRPFQGNLLRLGIPNQCVVKEFNVFKSDSRGFDVAVPTTFRYSEAGVGRTYHVYALNNGAEMVTSIALKVNALAACQISVEQANTSESYLSECHSGAPQACAAIDEGPSVCRTVPKEGQGRFAAFDETNRCLAGLRLNEKICKVGYVPSQFKTECKVVFENATPPLP